MEKQPLRKSVCSTAMVVVLSLAMLPSCRAVRPPQYKPVASVSVEEARAAINRSLEEQPIGFAASQVEMTDAKLSFYQGKDRFFTGGPSHLLVVFYWDTLGRMDVTPKQKGHVVRVWDKNEVYRFRVVIPDPERAKRFMDSMLVMSKSSRPSP